MAVNSTVRDAVHDLWDELADYDTTRSDDASRHLMTRVCDLIGADNSFWSGVVRLDDAGPEDPTNGWRPRVSRALHLDDLFQRTTREFIDLVETREEDETTIRILAEAGHYRVRLLDLRSSRGWHHELVCRSLGYPYSLWAGIPVNIDAEIYFVFLRRSEQAMFGETERDIVDAALRGLKWLHQRLLLNEGVGVASGPLSPTERRVLHCLLEGLTEKQIAEANGHSPHTTHEYVKRVFRKYGVTRRAQLMALWLGKTL